jgi:hypothetical protein
VIAVWRVDLPGLHTCLQQTYGYSDIKRARLGVPLQGAEIVWGSPALAGVQSRRPHSVRGNEATIGRSDQLDERTEGLLAISW